jgi:hypothetical protein
MDVESNFLNNLQYLLLILLAHIDTRARARTQARVCILKSL